MPKFFAVGIVLFLLLGAGYGAIQAARSIPWDCADWQAFAHDDRTTAILESLAENRGKTLYCGVDQSDTFAKAETWAAGKDRNERDDTIYQGERGRFRGFIAAQEGWLTEGESGVTGQPTSRIFEFPKEERQRRRKPKYEYMGLIPIPRDNIYIWSYLRGPERRHAVDAESTRLARAAWVATYGATPEHALIYSYAKSEGFFEIHGGNGLGLSAYAAAGGVNAWCVAQGYEEAAGLEVWLRDNWTYDPPRRTNPGPPPSGDYFNTARQTIRFTGLNCRRER